MKHPYDVPIAYDKHVLFYKKQFRRNFTVILPNLRFWLKTLGGFGAV